MEEEKRLKAVEIERAQRLKQNLERKKLERDEKMAQVEKQKAIREEQELAAKRKVSADFSITNAGRADMTGRRRGSQPETQDGTHAQQEQLAQSRQASCWTPYGPV